MTIEAPDVVRDAITSHLALVEKGHQVTQQHPAVLSAVVLALALLSTSCSATRPAATRAAASVSATGIALEDRAAITDLIHRYSYTWHGRDAAGWVGLFTEDAVIQASFVGKQAWSYGSTTERRTASTRRWRSRGS